MESNKKFSLGALLHNQNALLVISVFLAFFVWLAISLNEAPEVERVVERVKVTIDDSVPNQLGYEAFGADEIYVDITVKGKRYLVGDNVLTADDFEVTAVTTYVDVPGNYTLQLKATSKDANADYTIVAKSQDYIEVYFDTPKTAEIAVEPNVICESDELIYSEEYISAEPFASLEKVTVTGPATEVDKIIHALATITTEGELKTTETAVAELSFVDAYGDPIEYLSVARADSEVTVTIPVYKLAELPVTVEFTNSPRYYIENPLTIVCAPIKIDVAVDTVKLETLENISIGSVDFSQLAPGVNTLEFDTSGIVDAVPVNESQKFTVYVNTGNVTEQTFTLDARNISFTGSNDKFDISLVKDTEITVRVVGTAEELAKISLNDISASIDIGSLDVVSGENTVPLTVTLKNNYCWIYGQYTAAVTATEK